jgi:hypothetical protein
MYGHGKMARCIHIAPSLLSFEVLARLSFVMDMIDTVIASAIWTRNEEKAPILTKKNILQRVG